MREIPLQREKGPCPGLYASVTGGAVFCRSLNPSDSFLFSLSIFGESFSFVDGLGAKLIAGGYRQLGYTLAVLPRRCIRCEAFLRGKVRAAEGQDKGKA